jgi:hypothetical protein
MCLGRKRRDVLKSYERGPFSLQCYIPFPFRRTGSPLQEHALQGAGRKTSEDRRGRVERNEGGELGGGKERLEEMAEGHEVSWKHLIHRRDVGIKTMKREEEKE